ncbi:hypothetical protein V8G54_009338 [Vigna mungo]|uniref:Uncharacterized protein n=1 Tax=Vigna mungo TaxID=3915 RepID=A0AAQ3NWJ2_VIGMU
MPSGADPAAATLHPLFHLRFHYAPPQNPSAVRTAAAFNHSPSCGSTRTPKTHPSFVLRPCLTAVTVAVQYAALPPSYSHLLDTQFKHFRYTQINSSEEKCNQRSSNLTPTTSRSTPTIGILNWTPEKTQSEKKNW